ncbi:hypothetical protein H106_03332 [Trichophyton rubrum CBS 735.88]|uniref:Uncharacterized protein n=1 Tax=Trichophyton rubrum (strain ATCC MYA-4607 / CBS 118892) TaxID=559305 RepID=F2SQI3_TRIRC|nr:uncharacterized protein TERG_04847 [Trichophyton rubrum CBS 118892]EGD88601.2 hypothetical protein TERG_04847 [Trichophyton rubrum CBS 118892]EZG07215.1 hypothetical protein H106_03332 [Trichophyton rubrum CBS 735.88]
MAQSAIVNDGWTDARVTPHALTSNLNKRVQELIRFDSSLDLRYPKFGTEGERIGNNSKVRMNKYVDWLTGA